MSYVPVALLTPEELRIRRMAQQKWRDAQRAKGAAERAERRAQREAERARHRAQRQREQMVRSLPVSREWRAVGRAELLLHSAFLNGLPVEETYRRWQDLKTAERLLWLKGLREVS